MIDDTADFFDTDDFAEIIVLNGKKIKAIYDAVQVQHQDGFAVVTDNAPRLTVQTTDYAKTKADQGTQLVFRKFNYEIVDVKDDGTGITELYIHKKL